MARKKQDSTAVIAIVIAALSLVANFWQYHVHRTLTERQKAYGEFSKTASTMRYLAATDTAPGKDAVWREYEALHKLRDGEFAVVSTSKARLAADSFIAAFDAKIKPMWKEGQKINPDLLGPALVEMNKEFNEEVGGE